MKEKKKKKDNLQLIRLKKKPFSLWKTQLDNDKNKQQVSEI